MLQHDDLRPLIETKTDVFGSHGEKTGTLGRVAVDDGTDLPHFATVNTGLFGSRRNLVPRTEAEVSHGQPYVEFPRHFVKEAPHIDVLGRLSPEDEDRLYACYSQAGLVRGHDREPESASNPPDRQGTGALHRNPTNASGPAQGRHRTTPDRAQPPAPGGGDRPEP